MAVEFEKYLKQKLKQIKLDDGVFVDYIKGIIEEEQENDERVEALTDLLSGVLESNVDSLIEEILQKWNEFNPKAAVDPAPKPPEIEVEDRLMKLLESQKLATNAVREYTEEERIIREQILSQYSQTEVLENVEDEGEVVQQASGDFVKNTNAADVQARIKEKRENAKLESQMKKQKDKEDREKQKQQREEKKEKRKTVKGERRR